MEIKWRNTNIIYVKEYKISTAELTFNKRVSFKKQGRMLKLLFAKKLNGGGRSQH